MDQSLLGRLRSQRETVRLVSRVRECSVVYVYLRCKDSVRGRAGSPYYVGVAGDWRRPYSSRHTVPVPADERCIRVMRSGVTHAQAREWEKFYIQWYGRANVGTGRQLLHNRTDGGDGAPGAVRSEEHKECVGAAHRGKPKSPETRARMSAAARNMSADHRANLSDANRRRSPEVRAKVHATNCRLAAIRNGVDPDVWAKMTRTQRNNARHRASQLGITISEYLKNLVPRNKLTEEKVRWIFSMEGSMTQAAIAKEVGISFQHVSTVLRGERWAYLRTTPR